VLEDGLPLLQKFSKILFHGDIVSI